MQAPDAGGAFTLQSKPRIASKYDFSISISDNYLVLNSGESSIRGGTWKYVLKFQVRLI